MPATPERPFQRPDFPQTPLRLVTDTPKPKGPKDFKRPVFPVQFPGKPRKS